MTTRNSKFKDKNDYVDGEVLFDFDLDDTNNSVLNFIGPGIAENSYRNLQSNNVFENGDHFIVEEYLTSIGTNSTTDEINSTARYSTEDLSYKLKLNDEATGDTTHDPDAITNPANAFDDNKSTSATDDITVATEEIRYLGKTFGAKTVQTLYIDIKSVINGVALINSADIETFDGAIWSNFSSLYSVTNATKIYKNTIDMTSAGSIQGIRIKMNLRADAAVKIEWFWNLIEYGVFDSSSTLIINSNTKTLNSTEESICNYIDQISTANTSITVDITDGTTILLNKALNEVHGLNGFTSGTLEETFNLSATDTSETPELKGYGVYIK